MTAFRVASIGDDAMIRAILRDNVMPTWVELAIEREPSFFRGVSLFGRDWAVIAHEGEDLVGMYTASVLPVHLNGIAERIGYLGGLRVKHGHRRRIRHLREGYASIRPLAQAAPSVPLWFTLIASENAAARRLLEAGVRGLPAYVPVGDYVTLAIPKARQRRRQLWRPIEESDIADVTRFHNARASQAHLSPVLNEKVIRRIGVNRFFVRELAGQLHAIAALWDQREFKQVVARRYRWPIGTLLPVYNVYARIARRVMLPREGGALEHTFIAFLAFSDEEGADGRALIEDLLCYCRTPVATLGLSAANELLTQLRPLHPLRYEACVYIVALEDPPALSPALVQPEAALL